MHPYTASAAGWIKNNSGNSTDSTREQVTSTATIKATAEGLESADQDECIALSGRVYCIIYSTKYIEESFSIAFSGFLSWLVSND